MHAITRSVTGSRAAYPGRLAAEEKTVRAVGVREQEGCPWRVKSPRFPCSATMSWPSRPARTNPTRLLRRPSGENGDIIAFTHTTKVWFHLPNIIILVRRAWRGRPGERPVEFASAVLEGVVLDVDATIEHCHSENRSATPTRNKRALGYHPSLCGQLIKQPDDSVLLDLGWGDLVDARRAVVATHRHSCPPQDVPAEDFVSQRMEPTSGTRAPHLVRCSASRIPIGRVPQGLPEASRRGTRPLTHAVGLLFGMMAAGR